MPAPCSLKRDTLSNVEVLEHQVCISADLQLETLGVDSTYGTLSVVCRIYTPFSKIVCSIMLYLTIIMQGLQQH